MVFLNGHRWLTFPLPTPISSGNKGPKAKKPMVWGSRLYQVGRDGVPQLKDGMPVHVRLRSDAR